MLIDVAQLGASKLNPKTNAVVAQAGIPTGPDEHEAFGELDVMACLGVLAKPAPKNDNGHVEAVVARGVGNSNGVIIGARDNRSSKVAGELKDGETALFATGEDFDARVLCKDQQVAIVVGDDMVFSMDRKEKKISLAAFGCIFEISESGGINISSGGAGLIISGSGVNLYGGSVVVGGMVGTPATAVIMGVTGISGVPAPNVFIGVG